MYKVLIVDDNIEDINGLLRHVPWQDLNCTVTTAKDGQEGVKTALKIMPDIVITDISMPIINGIEMTDAIHKHLSNVNFIYMSCFDDFDYAVSGIKLGVSAYILKPIDIDEMIMNVKKIINKIEENKESNKMLSELKRQVMESRGILAERFLTNVILGVIQNIDVINSQAEFLEINTHTKYKVIVFQSDFTREAEDTQDNYISLFLLRNLICEDILSGCFGYCVNYDHSTLALIIKENSINSDNLILQLYDLQDLYLKNTGKTLTISISSNAHPLNGLYHEFKKLLGIARLEYFSNNGSVIMSDEMGSNQYEISTVMENEVFSVISEILYSTDDDEIDKFVDKYFSEGAQLSEVYAKALSFHIISSLNILLIEQNESFTNIFDNEIVIWKKLINYKTISNIKQWLKNILKSTKSYLQKKSDDTYVEIISDIKKNIDTNFANIQTLDQVVENLYISPGYANKLFHDHTNQTIFDYLLYRRMTEAKRLLKDKNLKSYEVAKMVGYRSNTYFTTAFKKYTKLTPTEYRTTLRSK